MRKTNPDLNTYQIFEIWFDFHALTWKKEMTLKLGFFCGQKQKTNFDETSKRLKSIIV